MSNIIIEREWIETAFAEEVNRFAQEKEAIRVVIRAQYKDTEKVKELSCLEGKVYFENFLILFYYTMHGLAGFNHGLLECQLSFDKSQNEHSYSLFEILTVLKSDNFRCYLPYSLYNEICSGGILLDRPRHQRKLGTAPIHCH